MIVIATGRRTGKTLALIRNSAETGAYIVCCNHAEAYRIAEAARGLGVEIPFPMTYTEFLRGDYSSKGVRGLLIDNTDLLLQHLARVPVLACTLTAETQEPTS